MKTSILVLLVLVVSYPLFGQIDSDGWTILDPSKAEKIIYVSSSSGDDTSAIIYNYPNDEIGDNPIRPDRNIASFKTIEAATATLQDGEAAWILFKRGDTFSGGIPVFSGKSSNEPFLYHSYGTRQKSPLFLTGSSPGIDHKGQILHFWVVGLNFYSHTRDPENPNFITGDEGDDGFKLQINKSGQEFRNILLEGNVFRFYKGNLLQDFRELGISSNINLRRNIIIDSYYPVPKSIDTNNQSLGLFSASISGITLDENIFDHNGWLIKSTAFGEDFTQGQATIENHNTYFKNAENTLFVNNSFHRPSSIGTKWTANSGVASAQNITIENNLYDDCNIAISIGGNTRDTPYRFKNITIEDNIISNLGFTDATNRETANGFNVEDWDEGLIKDNIFVNQKLTNRSGFGLSLERTSRDVTVANNIFYNLGNIKAISVRANAIFSNYLIENNRFSGPNLFKHFVLLPQTSVAGLDFKDNTYVTPELLNVPFRINNNNATYQDWEAFWPNENSNTTAINYVDPTRDFTKYVKEVLGFYSTNKFYRRLRKMDYLSWRDDFSAIAINEWIREGFEVEVNVDALDDDLNNMETNLKVTAFPNPVKDLLTLYFEKRDQFLKIKIFNAQGEKIQEFNTETGRISIDTSEYKAGLFIVSIDFDNETKRLKFIKE